jgi:putative endopeptidase
MRLTIAPGGLGMGDREPYLDDSAAGQKMRAAYLSYVETVLKLAGEEDPAGKARAVLDLETRLARPQWPSNQAYDLMKTANDRTPAELKAEAPGFDWDRFLAAGDAAGLEVLIVRQPPAMAPMVEVIDATPLGTWKAWLAFHLISDHAELLPAAVRDASFSFYGKVQSGQEAPEPRWEAGANLLQEYLGQAVGRLYVERYFTPEAKAKAAEMFDNIKRAMRSRLEHASWMSPSTRAEALKKIDTLVVKIGYPDEWPDFAGVRLERDDLWGDIKRLRARAWAERIATIRRPLDRAKWQMSVQSSGAAANPNLNEITVPAGSLEPPYFDPDADAAINYGGAGGVLGHELSHMFDNLGRQMDATGALRDWWAPEDAKRYEAVADKVVRQYSSYDAVPGHKIDGRRTLGENIADISGLTLAVDAYHLSLKGRPAPVVGGYTGDQRVFLGWAQMRMGKMRPETLVQVMRSDPHAPDYFRVNGVVRNIDAWYRAFAVKPTDKLYLPPEQRARFW